MKEFKYKYEMPAITVDAIIHTTSFSHFLFVIRKNPPHEGDLALCGGFLDMTETIRQSVKREVLEETSLDLPEDSFAFFKVLDTPDRDPRQRVVSHVFSVGIEPNLAKTAKAADDAASIVWIPATKIVDFLKSDIGMAFDHKEVLAEFINKVADMQRFREAAQKND